MTQHILLDGVLQEEGAVFFPSTSRAFQYGDSLFESMVAYRGNMLRSSLHWARLSKGMEILGYQANWGLTELLEQIQELLQYLKFEQGYARVRCQVWRKSGGLYTPTDNNCHLLIQASAFQPSSPKLHKAGFATAPLPSYTPLSPLKTGNALSYVLAGLERQKKGWGEIILLNTNKQIAEAGASNLFWINNDIIYTPSLDSGCLAGVTRRFLLNFWQAKGIKVQEGLYSPQELREASHIFTSNATSLHHITELEGQFFSPWQELEALQQILFQPQQEP